MLTTLLTIGLVAFLMAAMAVGVIFSGRELKGSCGGTGADCACDAQGIPRKCEKKDQGGPEELGPVGIGNPSRVS